MSERTFKSRNSRSKNSFRGRKRSGPGGGSRRGSFGKRRRVNNSAYIDPVKYVNKVVEKTPEEEYTPKYQFSDLKINQKLKKNIIDKGYVKPTPIQDQAIPAILEGKDLLGLANTGTGKTAAFLIPLIEKVLKNKNEKVLIMAPTRELALQIVDELRGFSKTLNIYSAACIGGANIRNQVMALKRRPNFVVGTPGRLKDLINRRSLNLSKFNNVVLDEVDRMLDMGFVNEIKELISFLPEERQSLFFSATISKGADALIQEFLNNHVKVSVKSRDTSDNVEQNIVKVRDKSKKMDSLHDLLIEEGLDKVLIFGRTKRGVESLSNNLRDRGFKSGSIHGDKTQAKRQKVLTSFKANKLQILVATDVAARGLDIPDVTHVINFDEPATYEDYIHRIGRTGRANKVGKALTFVG